MMSSFERVAAALRHELPDCVPVCPVMLLQGAAELGLSLETYFSQGDHLAAGQLRLLEKFGHDVVFGFPHVVEDITAFGGRLLFATNGPPSPAGAAIQSYDDVYRLTIPDPLSSPVLAETLRAIQRLSEQVRGEVPVLGACIAPFSLPSMLMSSERWMELLLIEEASIRAQVMGILMDVSVEFCAAWANAQLDAGADAIVLADGMASATVINRKQFIELALPIVQTTIARIQGAVIYEGVGDLLPMLDLLRQTGAVGVMLTCNDDLAQAKALVGRDLALIGNLNNIEMRRWSAAEMTAAAQTALEQAAPGGGFMLAAQGPEIPLGVPDDVIHAMVRAAHGWRY